MILTNPQGIATFKLAQGLRHKAKGEGISSIFINANPYDGLTASRIGARTVNLETLSAYF